MDVDKTQILVCPLCHSSARLIWKENKYRVVKCRMCSVISCLSGEKNSFTYGEDYFNRWYIRVEYKRKRYLKKLIKKISHFTRIPGGKLLDTGCGIGLLMEIMRENGWKTYGIDTSTFAYQYCKKKGLDVSLCQLKDAGFDSCFFDVVTVFDVLAHLQNPVVFLKGIYEILKENGILIIKTPSHPEILFRIASIFRFTGRSKSIVHIPAQIFHFTPHSLRNLLSKNDFETICTLRINEMPAFFLSFSPKTILVFAQQLLLRLISGSDSLILIARKKFHGKTEIKV